MRIFSKILFFLKRPIVIIVLGEDRFYTKKNICEIVRKKFKINKEIFIFESSSGKINSLAFFLKNSRLPILIILDNDINFSLKNSSINNIHFISGYDNEKLKKITNSDSPKIIKFGSNERSDIFASDIKYQESKKQTNFKVYCKGSFVPFWLEGKIEEKEINAFLPAIAAGTILGLNLVEISQSFTKK